MEKTEDQPAAIPEAEPTEFEFASGESVYAHVSRRDKDGDPWVSMGRLEPPMDEETIRTRWGGGIYQVRLYKRGESGMKKRLYFRLAPPIAGITPSGSAPTISVAAPSLDGQLDQLTKLAAVFKAMMPPPPPSMSDAVMQLLIGKLLTEKNAAGGAAADPLTYIRQMKEAARELGLDGSKPEPTWPEIIAENAPKALTMLGDFVGTLKGASGPQAVPGRTPPPSPSLSAGAAPAASVPPDSRPTAPPEEEEEMLRYLAVLNAVIGRVIRGFRAGESPEDVADILAAMFPDLLDQVEQYPEELVVNQARANAGKVLGGKELMNDPAAVEYLRATYRALVAIARETDEDPPAAAQGAQG